MSGTAPGPRAALLALALAACGYTFERDRSGARPEGGRLPRVAVLPFDNATFRRGLEIELTRILLDEIRARSPRAPSSPDEADWLLRGRIVQADERIYSEDRDDLVRESSFVVAVDVTLEDRAAEKVLGSYLITERVPFSDRAGRVRTLGQAQTEALRDIAERIVYWLEAGHPERRP